MSLTRSPVKSSRGKQGLSLGLGLLLSSSLLAADYGAGIGNSEWRATEPSPLYCELTHPTPEMGTARFTHRSGEDLKFFLEPLGQPLRKGTAELMALPPNWKPGDAPMDLGKVKVGVGEDGPTHQPIEHLASLRAIPDLNVFRPCDAIETKSLLTNQIHGLDSSSPSTLKSLLP